MLNLQTIYLITSSLNRFLGKNSIRESDISSIKLQIDLLFLHIPIPQYNFIPAQLERLTVNDTIAAIGNKRIDEIKYIKYPPAASVTKYGRCNIIGDSILYGAFNFMTILSEIKPEVGKIITHSEWKISEETPLKMFPVFFITKLPEKTAHNSLSLDIKFLHQNFISGFNDNEKKGFDMSMEFFAKCFAKNVEKDNHFDYFLSAYISKKIMEMTSINYDGIIYPSVESGLAFSNMAIRPDVFDRRFHLVEVRHEVNQIQARRNGFNNVISWSNKFDLEKGLIIWED